jgi:hypothetical protein
MTRACLSGRPDAVYGKLPREVIAPPRIQRNACFHAHRGQKRVRLPQPSPLSTRPAQDGWIPSPHEPQTSGIRASGRVAPHSTHTSGRGVLNAISVELSASTGTRGLGNSITRLLRVRSRWLVVGMDDVVLARVIDVVVRGGLNVEAEVVDHRPPEGAS